MGLEYGDDDSIGPDTTEGPFLSRMYWRFDLEEEIGNSQKS